MSDLEDRIEALEERMDEIEGKIGLLDSGKGIEDLSEEDIERAKENGQHIGIVM